LDYATHLALKKQLPAACIDHQFALGVVDGDQLQG
jgi:hypothetical protein